DTATPPAALSAPLPDQTPAAPHPGPEDIIPHPPTASDAAHTFGSNLQHFWQGWNASTDGQGILLGLALVCGVALFVWILITHLRDPNLGPRERVGFFGFWLASLSGVWFLANSVSPFFILFLLALALPVAKGMLVEKRAERLHRAQAAAAQPTHRTSFLSTTHLHATLHHDTQRMTGKVLEGQLKGFGLHELDKDDLKNLYAELGGCDPRGQELFVLWLNRHGPPHWPLDFGVQKHPESEPPPAPKSPMTRDEALKVLGLEDGCTPEQIMSAYKHLMARNHPDRGGSTYLAQLLNEARDLLQR
ncbi:MAG: hypothetical protein EBZ69_09600, partial [Alphaproteobacteria bacterium]|nr:hypothetical protein [Alphaproteobacteria bacterium]